MPGIGEIISNSVLKDSYHKVQFYVPEICEKAQPGQFAHVKIAGLPHKILRRPFSICDVNEDGLLTVVYKVVGEGTETLSQLPPGAVCDLMGPQGNPFSVPEKDEHPVIIAGGYGAAATYMIAKNFSSKGTLLLGARSSKDIILRENFESQGFDVRIATEDGTEGTKGLVTELIEPLLEELGDEIKIHFYACGPEGMLLALGKMLRRKGFDGELSLDHLMCCGVGACFACVVRVKADNEDGWRYARTCNEGPVFKASEIYYPQGE